MSRDQYILCGEGEVIVTMDKSSQSDPGGSPRQPPPITPYSVLGNQVIRLPHPVPAQPSSAQLSSAQLSSAQQINRYKTCYTGSLKSSSIAKFRLKHSFSPKINYKTFNLFEFYYTKSLILPKSAPIYCSYFPDCESERVHPEFYVFQPSGSSP